MTKSHSHKRVQSKAAGRKGRTEVKIRGGRVLDSITKSGKRATEVERNGSPTKLKMAARRLKVRRSNQKVLQVPQKDMKNAVKAMKAVGTKGTVKNMGGTKRRSV
jgi:hypothetical protein